jgi:hypothetical protein
MPIARQSCRNVISQEPKDAKIVMRPKLEKRLHREGSKSTIGNGLTDDRPPHRQPILKGPWIFWHDLSIPTSDRPHPSQSHSRLCGQGDFGIGIRRFRGALGPFPERRKIKPPDLPILLKGEVVQRILAVRGLARFQIIVVGQSCPPENAGSRERKSAPNSPSSPPRLNPHNRSHFVPMDIGPQARDFTFGMHSTERMSHQSFAGAGL